MRVRVATYQSVSGAGAQAMERLRERAAGRARPAHGLGLRRRGVRRGVEAARRDAKIMELPELPIQATCVRVPVMVGHAEAVWIETERPLSAERARELLGAAPSVRARGLPVARARPPGIDDVLVGRIRRDPTVEHGLALFLASDNLRKGAALNAIQIAELVLDARSAQPPEPLRAGGGAGTGSGTPNASLTTRSTFSRLPSTTGCEAAELEPREADAARGAHDLEAEVGEEVLREHRLVHAEALVAPTRPPGSGTRTPRARARRGRAPRRSRPGRATAAPTGSTRRRGTRT